MRVRPARPVIERDLRTSPRTALFASPGAVRERLLARDGEQAARRGSGRRRRDAESWEEDRASTHYRARAAARASQGKHCGCPFGGTTLSLKQQRGVRAHHWELAAGLPR